MRGESRTDMIVKADRSMNRKELLRFRLNLSDIGKSESYGELESMRERLRSLEEIFLKYLELKEGLAPLSYDQYEEELRREDLT